MRIPAYQVELCHYGVKGMKWGVRRSKEELAYNKNSVIAAVNRKEIKVKMKHGVLTCRMSDHAGIQAASRKVSSRAIVDAISKPLYINDIILDKVGRKSQRYIGKNATVNVNPDNGTIITVWPTSSRIRKKYSKGE